MGTLTQHTPQQKRPTPTKMLIRQPELCRMLDLSRNGLDLLRKRDASFPRPIKDGTTRQAPAYYVLAEVQQWLDAKIAARDAQAVGGVQA